MVRFLKVLIFSLVALVVIFLSIANRHDVTLSFDPFSQATPEIALTIPLFLILFGAIAIGVIIGGMAAWWAQHGKRKELRRSRKEIKELKAELDKLRGDMLRPYPALNAQE